MSVPKVTPWFHGNVKPKRKGVYERMLSNGFSWFCYFDGKRWRYGGGAAPEDVVVRELSSFDQNMRWRGLASDPAAKRGGK